MTRATILKSALCSLFSSIHFTTLAADPVELFPAKQELWKQSGPGSFSIKDNVATSQNGMGMLWYSGSDYANATFDIQFSLPDTNWNSGIFIRFPDPANDPRIAIDKGFECQISGDKADKLSTGAIYNIQAASHITLKKPGEWNNYQITTWNNKIIIVINGQLVNVFTAPAGRGDTRGHIGLQNHDPQSKVHFRTVAVREWSDELSLDQILDQVGVTRADWAQYQKKLNLKAPWYEKMDMGPAWANIFEDHYQGNKRLATLKGITLDLSPAESIKSLFDTETLRMSSAFQGKVISNGTPWTGKHGGINRMANTQTPIMQTSLQPGWADKNGSFAEQRKFPGHGNLAADHARFKGHFRYGSQVILDYTVLDSRVLELPTAGTYHHSPLVFRQLDLSASSQKRVMLVSDDLGSTIKISDSGKSAIISRDTVQNTDKLPKEKPGKVSVIIDRTSGDWSQLSMGTPSNNDLVDRNVNKKTYFRVVPKYTKTHKNGGDEEGVAVRLNDGLAAQNGDDTNRSFFFDNNKKAGRVEMDLNTPQAINRIHIYSEHKSSRAPQKVAIYGTLKDTTDPKAEVKNLEKSGWIKIAVYETTGLGDGGKQGAAILAPKGKNIGEFQKLLFICDTPKGNKEHTFFSEIDIYGEKAPKLRRRAHLVERSLSYCVHLKGDDGLKLTDAGNGHLTLEIPSSSNSTYVSLGYGASQGSQKIEAKTVIKTLTNATPKPRELLSLTKGGTSIYPETQVVQGKRGSDNTTWAVDTITLPVENQWNSMIKPGGLDLFADGDSAALCTWNGDVWVVTGLKGDWKQLKWRRFATGLYETLGLKIVDGLIYVNGRDQITRLHDQNNDGEADWYECFNNDVFVTANFHEFTFGLQTDNQGNFYISKGAPVLAGGRGFDKILPHNGVLLRISKDGKETEVIATGLRAPGGLGVGPDGEFTTGENEGTWQPCCKLNYFTGKDKFLGVENTAHHLKGQEMHLPLCYLPMHVDNSSGSQVWVPENANWGLKTGELIHLSYGKSSFYRVLKQEVDGTMQGGVVRIPISIQSSAMRARYHQDGSLYTLGFRGWQTNAAKEQGFQRIRYTGKPVTIPDQLKATDKGIYIRFEQKLDPTTASDRFSFKVERWKYLRTPLYGSGEFSIDNPETEKEKLAFIQESKRYRKHDTVEVSSSTLLSDGKTIFLQIPSMKTAEQMSIDYKLKFTDGSEAVGEIINTVHKMAKHTDIAILKQTTASEKTPANLKPGLHQTITAKGKNDHRTSRLPAQYVAKGDNISDMLNTAKGSVQFESKWNGYLILSERMSPKFQLQGKGTATLKINGKEVAKLGDRSAQSIQLDPGAHKFELHYTSNADGTGSIRTLWETDTIRQQSIPTKHFQHQPNEHLTGSLMLRHGRDIMMEQNCIQCHSHPKKEALLPDLHQKGPNMSGIGSRVTDSWLAQWLASPHTLKPGTTMPAFVDPTSKQGRQDAADMAAYLASLKDKPAPKIETKTDDTKLGGNHFHTLGCIACHSLPDQAIEKGSASIPLNNINAKFTPASLVDFLKKPNKHYAAIKMPDFNLSHHEARQLASYIHSASKGNQTKQVSMPVIANPTRGKQLISQHNCASCHDGLPAAESKLTDFSTILEKSWTKHPGHADKAPKLNLTAEDSKALEAYRASIAGKAETNATITHLSSHDYAERQFNALNCAACHSRDEQPSLLASLHSKSEHLTKGIPQDAHHKVDQSRPQMTYIGEMLHTDYLKKMIDGTVSERPRPWLAMRMPAFSAHADLLAQGLTAQHGMAPSKADLTNLDAEKVTIGKKLISSTGGFACIICHANGSEKALAAFEVEGINFDQVGNRLRSGYYHSWMQAPASITPSTKMPRYTINNVSPLTDYDKDANKQFDAIQEYLKSIADKKK